MIEKEFVIPSSPKDQEKIRRVMQTISDCYTRIESEKDLIKDEIEALHEDFKIPKKYLNKLARTFHKNNYDQQQGEQEEFSNLYETVLNSGKC